MDILDRWQRAETAALAGTPDKHDLPDRLATLLRCLVALDRGNRAQIAALRIELAGPDHDDLCLILDMALADDRAIDPTAIHRRARRAHPTARGGLPTADLSKMASQYRTGGKPRGSKALNEWARKRPVLRITLEALKRRGRLIPPGLPQAPPRCEAVAAAIVALQFRDPRAIVQTYSPHVEQRLDLSRYPGWDGDNRLDQWLDGARPGNWNTELADLVSNAAQAPTARRKALLARLLDRIDRDLRSGQVPTTVPLIQSTCRLASTIPGLHNLVKQLDRLANRIEVTTGLHELAPAVADSLWEIGRHLSPGQRSTIAELILDRGTTQFAGATGEAVFFILGQGTNWDRRIRVVEDMADEIPQDMLVTAISAEPDPARRAALLGLHASERRHTHSLLSAIPTIVQRPELTWIATHILESAARDHAGRPSFRVSPAWTQAVDAVASTHIELKHLPDLLDAIHGLGKNLAQKLHPAARRALAQRSSGTPTDLALRLITWDQLKDDDAIRALQRTLGRRLRALPDDDADDLALLVIAYAYDLHPSIPDRDLVGPLTRFLLRDGPDRAKFAAERLPDDEGIADGVATWSEEHSTELGNDEFWFEFQDPDGLLDDSYWCSSCQTWHQAGDGIPY